MSKQIEEVMALVIEVASSGINYGAAEGSADRTESLKMLHEAEEAVNAKLRELLPVWQPIESAPAEGMELFVVIGINVTNKKAGCKNYTTDPYCVFRGHEGSFVRWPHRHFQPTHWMPLPKAPE